MEQEPKIEETKSVELTDSEWEIVLNALRLSADYSSADGDEGDGISMNDLIKKLENRLDK